MNGGGARLRLAGAGESDGPVGAGVAALLGEDETLAEGLDLSLESCKTIKV